MGLSYTGNNCFDTGNVTGYSLVPEPPARIMPLRWVMAHRTCPLHVLFRLLHRGIAGSIHDHIGQTAAIASTRGSPAAQGRRPGDQALQPDRLAVNERCSSCQPARPDSSVYCRGQPSSLHIALLHPSARALSRFPCYRPLKVRAKARARTIPVHAPKASITKSTRRACRPGTHI
jgi:hypothetical protein